MYFRPNFCNSIFHLQRSSMAFFISVIEMSWSTRNALSASFVITGFGSPSRSEHGLPRVLQRRRAVPRSPVKPDLILPRSLLWNAQNIAGWGGLILSRLVLIIHGNLRSWMARLAGSDLPKFKNLQPTFALMAQTTCLASLSACTQYWPAKERRDGPFFCLRVA
jgi:hypothetical protein